MFRTVFRQATRGIPRVCARRYNQNYFQNLQPRPSRFKRSVTGAFWLVSVSAFAYYMWWPKHTFPKLVAAILRKGIIAESDKGEKDYQLALKFYLQALEECKAQKMDPISDEYTGVQLKVAEMYERLSMKNEAAFVYNEIATLYLSALKAEKHTPEAALIRGLDHRAHVIQKDLRVALKLVELNQNNPLLSKAILVTHLLIAQDEVNRKLGVAKSLLFEAVDLPALGKGSKGDVLEADGNETKDGIKSGAKAGAASERGDTLGGSGEVNATKGIGAGAETDLSNTSGLEDGVLVLETNPEAWYPFAEEFFVGLEMLSAICISVGDINAASNINLAMTSKMLLAGIPPNMLLLAQCNTASLLFFQAEQLQAQQQHMCKQFAQDANVDYDIVKAMYDPLQPLSVGDDEAQEVRRKILSSVLDEDKAKYEQLAANRTKLLEMVAATYESVINGAKQLPNDVVAANSTISETVALATYGLGVMNLHLSDYDKAERLLRTARVRSRSCGYDTLIVEIERELGKLQEERKLLESK